MSSKRTLSNEGSVEEQADEHIADELKVEAVEETPELRASVEQDIQAKVDTNHPDATPGGLTLAAEERLEAREWEIERTQVRYDRRQDSDREERTRRVVSRVSDERRVEFEKRAASVNRWADPEQADPREQLTRAELARVNQESARLGEALREWSQAAISRRLAERVVDGRALTSAVVGVFEELKLAPGQVIPIAAVGEVARKEVSIEGRVKTLWKPSHPKIAQVGLIEDESGHIKFTAWKRSQVPFVREGEQVVLRDVARSQYQGRYSVALTGRSQVWFPEREGLSE